MQLLPKLDADFAFGISYAEARLVLGSPNQLTIVLELLHDASRLPGWLKSRQDYGVGQLVS